MIKLFGALLILVSGSSIGWILGSIYLNRIKELKDLQIALNILQTEISYGRTILPDALKMTANVLSPPLTNMFLQAADQLNSTRSKTFSEIWQQLIKRYSHKSYLGKEDLEILINWGRQIGTSTVENQININQIAIKRLEQQEDIARELAKRRVKPVRYAGVLISLMVIIVFY